MLVAAYNVCDESHERVARLTNSLDDELVTTPMAVAEMDHLVGPAQEQLWHDLEVGAVTVRWWADGVRDTLAVVRQHPWIGLTDASLVALTRIARTDRIATLDHHFRSLTTPDGQPLTVLPD